MLGWFIAGAVAGAILVTVIDRFWDSIASWLNNTAANAVERVLGYDAKKFMQRAVVTVGRIRDKLHNTSVVYTKKTPRESFYTKVTYDVEAPVYQIDDEVLKEIERKGQLVNAFEYRS